jgi:hypothetical protein
MRQELESTLQVVRLCACCGRECYNTVHLSPDSSRDIPAASAPFTPVRSQLMIHVMLNLPLSAFFSHCIVYIGGTGSLFYFISISKNLSYHTH